MELNPKEILEQAEIERRQSNRRRIFKDAYAIGSQPWSDLDELDVVTNPRGANLTMSMKDLHDIIVFFEDLGLFEVKRFANRWDYRITSDGIQAYEGDKPWPAGVAPK